MIIHDVPQLSDLWWSVRKGIPTASCFHRIITAKDGKPSKGMAGYAAELFADSIQQNPPYFSGGGKPINVHTERGRDLEAEALEWYAFSHKIEIERVGFVTTNDGRFGCSPDAFACKNGKRLRGLEVKCPEAKKVVKHSLKGVMPLDYKAQCHGGLVVCEGELEDWTLIEYCPEITPLVVDIKPDSFTELLKVHLEAFDELYKAVKKKLGLSVKEPEVTDKEIVEAWDSKLATLPDRETLNSWLPEMSEIPTMPTKRQVWTGIKAYGEGRGWVFKMETKEFVEA